MNWDSTLFLLARHGKTASNEKGIYRSWSNAPEAQLTSEGRQEVEESAQWLLENNAPIELIISDSLDRTLQTAEAFSSILNVDRIIALRGLHPLSMGDWTGKSKEKYPVEPFMKDHSKVIPGGESVGAFNAREFETFKGIMPLVDTMPPGSILIVGHGSTVCFLHNNVFDKGEKKIGYEGLVDPAGIIACNIDGMVPILKARSGETRMSAQDAGYMELVGAKKDGDCLKVIVPGGVSRELGCCNEFKPDGKSVKKFSCGTCEYVKGASA
jgi:broad specificity phosphatase PhoE